MSPKQQEQLFRKVQARFPRWSKRKCSGYVHGIVDESHCVRPCDRQVKAFSPKRSYAVGYVHGFIDARGEDACKDPRLIRFKSSHTLAYRWWKNVAETTPSRCPTE